MNIGGTRAEYFSRFLMQGRRIEAAILATVTGHFGQDPFRPYFLAETPPFSGTFRPRNMDVSAKKYGRFDQEIGTFRPRNMDVSAKIIVIIASDSAIF